MHGPLTGQVGFELLSQAQQAAVPVVLNSSIPQSAAELGPVSPTIVIALVALFLAGLCHALGTMMGPRISPLARLSCALTLKLLAAVAGVLVSFYHGVEPLHELAGTVPIVAKVGVGCLSVYCFYEVYRHAFEIYAILKAAKRTPSGRSWTFWIFSVSGSGLIHAVLGWLVSQPVG